MLFFRFTAVFYNRRLKELFKELFQLGPSYKLPSSPTSKFIDSLLPEKYEKLTNLKAY